MSDGSNKLKLEIGLERGPAVAEAAKVRNDLRKLNQQILADTEAAAAVEKAIFRSKDDSRVKSALDSLRTERDARGRYVAGFKAEGDAHDGLSERMIRSLKRVRKEGVDHVAE